MVTGSMSFLASVTFIVMIWKSNLKLSTTYRRLLCSISVFNVFLSLSLGASSLPMPDGSMWAAIGNSTTCDIQGFATAAGLNGAVLYSISISTYFLLIIRFDMKEAEIREKFEPLFHVIPILYAFGVGFFISLNKSFNPTEGICWIASRPDNCMDDPNVECISSGNLRIMKFAAGGAVVIAFLINCAILTLIWCTVHASSKNDFQTRLRSSIVLQRRVNSSALEPVRRQSFLPLSFLENHQHDGLEEGVTGNEFEQFSNQENSFPIAPSFINPNGPLAARLSQRSKASIRRDKEIFKRIVAYIIASVMSYFFTGFNQIYENYYVSNEKSLFPIIILSKIFFPLQGVFSILLYTYPHVISYQRRHKSSYFKALFAVVKSGGDDDQKNVRWRRNITESNV